MNSTIPTRSRAEKSARTRARKKNPLRAAKLVAKREVPAVKVFRSGREVCNLKLAEGRRIYTSRMLDMAERQLWMCGICGELMWIAQVTFDHEDGRGSGGANRDDRVILPSGKLLNRAVHLQCNILKGSKRGYETGVRRTMRTTI